jgi:hypothetical protein
MHRRSCSICVPLSQVLFSLGRHLTKRFRQPQNSRPNYQMLFHFSPRVGRLIGSRWLRHSVLGDPCESVSTSARLLGYSIKAQSVPKRFSSMSVSGQTKLRPWLNRRNRLSDVYSEESMCICVRILDDLAK